MWLKRAWDRDRKRETERARDMSEARGETDREIGREISV